MSKRILVVEDEEDNMQILRDLLTNAGYEMIEAENGEEALAAVKQRPDLILMDIQIPIIDGYEATRRIKADPCCDQSRSSQLRPMQSAEGKRKHALRGVMTLCPSLIARVSYWRKFVSICRSAAHGSAPGKREGLLHCMSLKMAQSGHAQYRPGCPLSGD